MVSYQLPRQRKKRSWGALTVRTEWLPLLLPKKIVPGERTWLNCTKMETEWTGEKPDCPWKCLFQQSSAEIRKFLQVCPDYNDTRSRIIWSMVQNIMVHGLRVLGTPRMLLSVGPRVASTTKVLWTKGLQVLVLLYQFSLVVFLISQ